jgi:hypothetical protein
VGCVCVRICVATCRDSTLLADLEREVRSIVCKDEGVDIAQTLYSQLAQYHQQPPPPPPRSAVPTKLVAPVIRPVPINATSTKSPTTLAVKATTQPATQDRLPEPTAQPATPIAATTIATQMAATTTTSMTTEASTATPSCTTTTTPNPSAASAAAGSSTKVTPAKASSKSNERVG